MTTGMGRGPRTPGSQTRLFELDREPVYLSSWGKKEQGITAARTPGDGLPSSFSPEG